ncbi:hypothetical protein A3Q56_01180 [Intoshia linei]|uniref:Uncharacterized protein n=1 Tax=Intoshia linei TaxID=1819745 RepID=A0A177BC07_9BILA|nr:hypothetical protein A3Q56_01180 [Intoshia linei]
MRESINPKIKDYDIQVKTHIKMMENERDNAIAMFSKELDLHIQNIPDEILSMKYCDYIKKCKSSVEKYEKRNQRDCPNIYAIIPKFDLDNTIDDTYKRNPRKSEILVSLKGSPVSLKNVKNDETQKNCNSVLTVYNQLGKPINIKEKYRSVNVKHFDDTSIKTLQTFRNHLDKICQVYSKKK